MANNEVVSDSTSDARGSADVQSTVSESLGDSQEAEEEGVKKDEVDSLMDKYDNEEKHKEFLKSPAYKAQQKAK